MKILNYRTAWNVHDNIGSIRFYLENQTWSQWTYFNNAIEYQVVLMLLQNEDEVYYTVKDGKGYYYTSIQETGF